mgnify:FL=1
MSERMGARERERDSKQRTERLIDRNLQGVANVGALRAERHVRRQARAVVEQVVRKGVGERDGLVGEEDDGRLRDVLIVPHELQRDKPWPRVYGTPGVSEPCGSGRGVRVCRTYIFNGLEAWHSNDGATRCAVDSIV